MHDLWNIFSEKLYKVSDRCNAKVHSFVLMSNHYHILMTTPEKNLDEIMCYFGTESSKDIGKASGRINHCLGGRYKWSVIYEQSYFVNAYKYIYRNPIKAGICDVVEEYPWSTLDQAQLRPPLSFPLHKSVFAPRIWSDQKKYLEFLNEKFEGDGEEKIRRALRRFEYQPPKSLK